MSKQGRRANFMRGAILAGLLTSAAAPPAEADWGFINVFDFADGYPGTGASIGLASSAPSIGAEHISFVLNAGPSQTGLIHYYRGTLTPLVETTGNVEALLFDSDIEGGDVVLQGIGSTSGPSIYHKNAAGWGLNTLASASTSIPSGTGTFTGFSGYSNDGQRGTFVGFGESNQWGIYFRELQSSSGAQLILERGSLMPNGGDSYQSFGPISHRGNTIVFGASGNTRGGIYARSITGTFILHTAIAERTTTVPGRSGTFEGFASPAYDGSATAFAATGAGVSGVYTNLGGPLRVVADNGTPIPGGSGNFGFDYASISVAMDDGDIAFDTGANLGVFIERDGVLEKVVANGDVIHGRTVSNASISRNSLSNGHLALRVRFADGGFGYYAAFTEHRWDPAGGAGGNWDDPLNWPLGALPRDRVHSFIQPAGQALIHGPSEFTLMRSLTLGAQTTGLAELRLQPAGQVVLNERLNIETRGKLSGSGALHATGGIDNFGEIDLGASGATLSGATLDNRGTIRGGGEVRNTLLNRASGEIVVGSGQHLRFRGSSNTNQGLLRLLGGVAEFSSPLTNTTTGSILGRGTLLAEGGLTNRNLMQFSGGHTDLFGNVNNTSTGRITITGAATLTFWDDVVHHGSITTGAGSRVAFLGDVTGGGTFFGQGAVEFDALLAGGASPGILSFGGEVSFNPDAMLEIDIQSTAPGGFDALMITQDALLGGTLSIRRLAGYTPIIGQSFQIITAGEVIGRFDSVSAAAIPGGLTWRVEYHSNAVTLKIGAPLVLGDMDGNGVLDAFDVDDFELALADRQAYLNTHPGLDPDVLGDMDGSGGLDAFDVDDFETALAGGASIPQPATLTLLAAWAGWCGRRRPAAREQKD